MSGRIMLFVAPPVFWAPRGLFGPGCLVCPWAAVSYICCLWPHGCSGRRVVCLGRAALCARGRRPAREIATRELRSEWSISRPALALPPPTGTAARPSGPSGTHHTSGAWCAEDDSPRLEARPGPAADHGHRSQALRSLRHPPHRQRWGFGSIRSCLPACRRRVAVLMVRFPPPIGGGQPATCGGVVIKLQTRCAKAPKVGHCG